MIIDDAMDMLNRVKGAVKAQLPKAECPDPDMDASLKIVLEQQVDILKETAGIAREAFLESLEQDSEQWHRWDVYQAVKKANKKAVRLADAVYEPEEEDARRRELLASLDVRQKRLYREASAAHRAWVEQKGESERVEMKEVLFGIKPSDELTAATVAFPDDVPMNRRSPILLTLNNLRSYARGKTVFPAVRFTYIHDAHDRVTGLQVVALARVQDAIPEYLDDLTRQLHQLKTDLPSLCQRWKKIRTNRGDGYHYQADENLLDADPVFAIASLLVANEPAFKQDRHWVQPNPGTLAIVLTGAAAKAILEDELGLNLRDIPRAESQERTLP